MVRERKTREKDIDKIHELIDSASLPKQKTSSLSREEQLENIRRQLAEQSIKNHKQVASSQKTHAPSGDLKPHVVVHEKEKIEKKEEKVIRIDLGPQQIKKEKEPAPVRFIPVKEDQFAHEPLFEIEKVAIPPQEFSEVHYGKLPTTSDRHIDAAPVTPVWKKNEEHLPEFQPVSEATMFPEASGRLKRKKPKAFYQRSQLMTEEQTQTPTFLQQEEDEIPSSETVEYHPLTEERKEPMRFEMKKKGLEELKQKKMEEKQEKQLAKQKEREAKHLAKEQEKRLKIETLESQQKQQQEQKRKEWEMRQAFAQAEEQEQEEKRLVKEQEKKSRLEIIERQHKEKEQRKQKKIEEKKARIELKEKKRETKRLAKEHDQKLKLEWIEFQHQQRQNQKQQELEKKKAAVEAKQKEQEEQRLLKEREEQVRSEQIQLLKKEKEERERKKMEEKQVKYLAKEQERRLKMETFEAQKQKELLKKQAVASATEQDLQEQRLLKEMEEKSRLELLERQKKEQEKQKISKAKKEKKIPVIPSFEKMKPREEQADMLPWKTVQEDTEREPDEEASLMAEEPTPTETQKQLLKEKKRQQKQLEREQKEQARRERLEQKKKEKEQKIQRKLEEKQRKHLFGLSEENKQIWQEKNEEEKLTKRQEAEKERDEKRRLKEGQKRKERAFAIEEMEQKEKEKTDQKLRESESKKERRQISMLSFGKAKDTGVVDERKLAEQQKQTMDLVRIAAEEKDIRKTKAFERKMQKQQRKKEKEEQKYKMKEDESARRKMDIHMKEEIMKEKLTNQIERDDPFVAFDSIDQDTAVLLGHYGYNSVEKLRQATVKDLLRTGLKKKTAQRIIAECGEFVEWQVFDSIDHF